MIMPDPRLTVLFTTHNGARWIGRVLEAYAAQKFDAPWRLVVVENGSTDETAHVLVSFKHRLPLVIVSEPALGQNRARNAGLAAIVGELIVMTDDDAVPHAGFLQAWARLLDQHLDYDIFGAKIVAAFEAPPRPWVLRLAQQSEAAFGQRDLPAGPVEADEIFSPNMAVRRKIFDAGHRFDEAIGPNASNPNYPTGSETEFLQRMAAAGHRAMFIDGPVVSHIVRAHQTTFAHFKGQARRDGRSQALREKSSGALRAPPLAAKPFFRHLPPWAQLEVIRTRAIVTADLVQRNFAWWRYYWWRAYWAEAEQAGKIGTQSVGAGQVRVDA
jgi:Glycosyl transferase family 2